MNPGLLGTAQEFKKRFETPILRGRDADGTDEDHKIGNERLQEMANLVRPSLPVSCGFNVDSRYRLSLSESC